MLHRDTSGCILVVNWQICWKLLYKAIEDKKQHDVPNDRDTRLYCKLLLHYMSVLIQPAIMLLGSARCTCNDFRNARHQTHFSETNTLVIRGASDMLELFTWLLMETRNEECMRPMADLLLPLYNLFQASYIFNAQRRMEGRRESTSDTRDYDVCLDNLSLRAPVVLERIAAGVPVECVDDKTASALLPCGCPDSVALPVRRRRVDGALPDDAIRDVLSDVIDKQILFNREYVESVTDDQLASVSVCDILFSLRCDNLSLVFCALLWVVRLCSVIDSTFPLYVSICRAHSSYRFSYDLVLLGTMHVHVVTA